MPSLMPLPAIPSRASTLWYTEWVRMSVRPSPRSTSSSRSSDTWPGHGSNSKVCVIRSGVGVPWNTPWKPYSVPSGSTLT